MTAIVQPAVVSGGGGGGGTAPAINDRSNVVGLVPAATHTLLTINPWGVRKLRGYRVTGTEDAEAWIEVDGVSLWGSRGRVSRVMDAYVVMPNPEALSSSAVVRLRVMNTGDAAGDFEGTLFGE